MHASLLTKTPKLRLYQNIIKQRILTSKVAKRQIMISNAITVKDRPKHRWLQLLFKTKIYCKRNSYYVINARTFCKSKKKWLIQQAKRHRILRQQLKQLTLTNLSLCLVTKTMNLNILNNKSVRNNSTKLIDSSLINNLTKSFTLLGVVKVVMFIALTI